MLASFDFFSQVTRLTGLQLEALKAAAAAAAEDAVLQRLDIYISLIGGAAALIIFILGFVGFSQVRDIRTRLADTIKSDLEKELRGSADFRRQIKAEVEQDVLKDISREIGRLERLIDIGRLSSLSQKVLESDSFTNVERDSLLQSLTNLKDDASVVLSPEYQEALRASITSFYAAGLWSHLERIDDDLAPIIVQSIVLASPMMEAYGLRSLGETPITQEEIEKVDRRLLFYIKAVRDLKFPEAAFQFMLAYEIWKNGRSDRTDRLISAAGDFSPDEKATFVESLMRRSSLTSTLEKKDLRTELVTLAKKFEAVVSIYQAELLALRAQTAT